MNQEDQLPTRNFLTQKLLALVLACASLCACAPAQLQQAVLAQSAAQPCCTSAASLPPAEPSFHEQAIALTPATLHFDFGLGLAPFFRLHIDPAASPIVEVQTLAKASPKLTGGDGTLHFAHVRLLFFDAGGQPVPHEQPLPPSFKTVGWSGHYALATNVHVPAGASVMVVTSDCREIGRTGATVYNSPGGGMMMGSTYVPLPGGPRAMPYTLVPYGDVNLIVPGARIKPPGPGRKSPGKE